MISKHTHPFFAISQRKHGSMRLENRHNRTAFLESLNIRPESVVSAQLVHGNHVQIVKNANQLVIPETDAIMTNNPNIYISITVADCLPIALYHKSLPIKALLHAGWRGLNSNIIEISLKKMIENWQVSPNDIIAHIGPGISSCHCVVKADVAALFKCYPQAISSNNNRDISLDIKKIALAQLQDMHLKNISTNKICTACQSKKYFSHRVDQTKPVNTMMAIL